MSEPIVRCDNLVKIYKTADLEVFALQGLDLHVAKGEMLALAGASGSGKSTLLNIIGGLDIPSAGRCMVAGFELTQLNAAQRLAYRRSIVGHLWQQSGRNLVADFTIATNIDLPQVASQKAAASRRRWTHELLDLVGLGTMGHKYPSQLSGGEQQRASIAVALANDPRLLLADEPTGELDSATAEQVLALLRGLNQQLGLTVIVVTHDPAVAAAMGRTIAIRDGRTSTETRRRKEPVAANGVQPQRASTIIGLPGATHRELLVLDKADRLQLPHDMVVELRFDGRVEVRHGGDHLELWPIEQDLID